MIHIVVTPECEEFAVFVCCKFDIHKCRRSLSCISNVLELIEYQRYRTFKDLDSCTDQGFICRRELVTKGSSGMVLNKSQVLQRNTDTISDHRHMEMDTDGFGMNSYHAVFINVAITTVRFKMEMWLT